MSTSSDERSFEDYRRLWLAAGNDAEQREAAFAALYQRYQRYVLMLARELQCPELDRAQSANDVLQTVARRLLARLSCGEALELRSEAEFLGLLRTISKNYLSDRRSRKRDLEWPQTGASEGKPLEVADSAMTPSAIVTRSERELLIADLVRRAQEILNALDWDIYSMRCFDGQSFVEIGEQLAMTPDAVRRRFDRASAKLRETLGSFEQRLFDVDSKSVNEGTDQP